MEGLSQRELTATGDLVLYHVTSSRNRAAIEANGLIPAIGERAARYGETTAAVYCYRTILDAWRGIGSWLGEEYEDDPDPLLLLRIELPSDDSRHAVDNGWETQVAVPIRPDCIAVIDHDFGGENGVITDETVYGSVA